MNHAPRNRDAALAVLGSIAPTIMAAAAQADRDARFPDEVISAIANAGLLRLWIPRAYGGDELPLPDALEVFEAAARVDGSAGWLITIGVGGGLFAAQMEQPTAREVFGPPDALIAGSGAPDGVAVPVDGGYRVTGSWKFASGAHHASWITANCVIEDGTRQPPIRAMAFPASTVEILDTWQVSGMRATGSHDFLVRDRFVPKHRSFDVFGRPREPGPLYRFPFGTIAELSFASVALGIARHALDAFDSELSPARRQRADAQGLVRTLETTLAAERVSFLDRAAETWSTVDSGWVAGESQRAGDREASALVTRTSAATVEQLYLAAGMAPLFLDSELGRCWRDVHAVTQHVALSPAG